ncbi:transposase [Parabacteroides distasonis]|uniref:Transposase n=1 Tax=Parabacteroides distasonis TaxID=823 RepID=A0A1Y4IA49_PARDI|nr:transposase [Parabacteroides distasonis]
MRVKFYQIYQDLELEEKIVSARAIVNRYHGKDETFKTLYNVFKEYNDNLETRMKQIPNIQLKLTPDLFFLKYKKISYNQLLSFRFVLGL